jgi:hypothetical protein
MGDSQYHRGEYDDAIASYQEGLKLAPSSVDLHNKLDAAMKACRKSRVTLPVPFTCGARNPLVKLIPPATYPRVVRPGTREVTIPADEIERVLQPVGKLSVPPSSNAPPGAFVTFAVEVGISDNVILGQVESDGSGLAQQVLPAAKAWKFRPPMVRGKPVSITVHVIVIF